MYLNLLCSRAFFLWPSPQCLSLSTLFSRRFSNVIFPRYGKLFIAPAQACLSIFAPSRFSGPTRVKTKKTETMENRGMVNLECLSDPVVPLLPHLCPGVSPAHSQVFRIFTSTVYFVTPQFSLSPPFYFVLRVPHFSPFQVL